jgi:hypothetical protein
LRTVGKRPQGEVAQDGDGQYGEKEKDTHDGDIYTNSPVIGIEKRPVASERSPQAVWACFPAVSHARSICGQHLSSAIIFIKPKVDALIADGTGNFSKKKMLKFTINTALYETKLRKTFEVILDTVRIYTRHSVASYLLCWC